MSVNYAVSTWQCGCVMRVSYSSVAETVLFSWHDTSKSTLCEEHKNLLTPDIDSASIEGKSNDIAT